MICTEWPRWFSPDFEAVGCFVEVGLDILLLLRSHLAKIEPNKWGMSGGKVEEGESIHEAVARELREETGLCFHPDHFEFIITVVVEYPRARFLYHIFRRRLRFRPQITLNGEHQAFIWTPPSRALERNLMLDDDSCIKLVYNL